eukprot:Em0035g4a
MSGKPLLLPEIYSGESQCWSDWIEHFESVAALNKWAAEDEKLKWLKVRLAGKARTAFQKLPRNVREEYGECLKALKQRFEPDSKKELYVAELHTRTRRKDEDWATFGDALKVLADKAYSDLEEKARESGAQKGNIATTAAAGPETLAEALKVLNDRLQKLEVLVVNKAESSSAGKPISQGTTQGRGAEKKRPTCWHCGRKGHIARNCWERQSQQSQGNFKPLGGTGQPRGEGHVKAQKKMVTVPTLSVSSAISFSVSGMIGACPLELLVDTGATVSLLNVNMWNKIDSTKLSLEQWTGKKLVGVNGTALLVKGLIRAQVCIEGFEFVGNFVVSGELVVDAILGLDFLQQHNCVIDVGKKLLKFPSVDLSVGLQDAVSEMEIIVKPLCNETFPIRVLNPRDSSIVLQKGVELAKMELIEQDLVQLNAASVGKSSGKESSVDQAELWNLVLGAGDQLNQNEKEMLFSLLMEYKDVFSFRSSDLGHTSLLQHRINTGSEGPIQCLPRRIPQARREDVRRLLREMLDNGIVEPSEGPWSSPIVLAKVYKTFGTIAKPLHRLTEKNITFQWTDTCQQAFDNLRKCLMTSPILAHPDWSKSFILDTDASDCGIGAVLSQVNSDASECVIAYASQSLSRQEQRYCVTRRELLAVVEFVKHFREYLLGRRFTLRTDHGSLVWLKNFKEPEGQLARWLERLEEYDFTVVHRQGSLHNNADALSRIPCRQCGRSSHSKDVPEGSALVGVVNSLPFQTYTAEQMRQFQSVDPIIGPVYNAVSLGELPSSEELNTWGRESKWLLQQWDSLVLDKGLLWRKDLEDANKSQFILPYVLHDEVLKELHEGAAGGHLGKGKMLGRLKERLYWPGCGEDVEEWCKRCDICARRKSTAPKRRAGLQTLRAGYPMQTVCVDIMGPLPETNRGSKYVLVAADCFTKWVEVYGIPNQEALTVAVKLVDEMFCRFSPPEQIHSDQGRQFESELIKEICQLLQIKKSHTTPYRPQGNGMVEHFNRTLLDMLATAVGDNPADWENYIHKLCFAYNTSVHSSTGYSPFFLMFGRQAAIPVNLMYPLRREEEDKELPDFVQELKKRLQDAYASVRVHCQSEHLRQKAIYDRKAHGEQLKEGDLVWLFLPEVPRGQCRKLFHPWTGPYTVVKNMGSCTYKIKNQRGGRYQIVHFDRLKPCMKQSTEADVHPTPVERTKRAVVPQQTRVDANSRVSDEDLLLSDDDVEEGEHEDLPVDIPAGPAVGGAHGEQHPPPAAQEAPEAERRYPIRQRRAPDRYGPYIQH